MNLFSSARLRLTLWYVFLIMIISGLFSLAFYNVSTQEIQRIINHTQDELHRHQDDDFDHRPPPSGIQGPTIQDLQESENRLLMQLFILNGAILILSAGAAFLLSGRTLKPIKLMIDEQNQFISSSSHELRTPIATMRAEMEGNLLEPHISDKKARELIKSNLEELLALQSLSNNLLKLAQVHSISPEKYREELSIKELIEIAKKKVSSLAHKKQITISSHLTNVKTRGDKSSLVEVFVILLDNAIKYSFKKTTITITSEKSEHNVKISITDQGIGIAEKDLEHIFERFYRADKSRSQADGFGLGLSIARKTIEANNGSIHVTSKVNQGTTFTITLPTI
jgi:two-component system sensor histidine kinase CiaH